MTRLRMLRGMAIVALPDIASGFFVAHALCKIYGIAPKPSIYGIGLFFALLPDIDIPIHWILVAIWPTKFKDIHHRKLTHYPLLVVPLVFMLLSYISLFWAFLGSMCLLLHFMDDTFDRGGLPWLWPISNKRFQLLFNETKPGTLEEALEKTYLPLTTKSIGIYCWAVVVTAMIIFW